MYWVTTRMVFRLTSGKWLYAAAMLVAPALAFGYYAGDPANLGITVNATLSGAGSVHGRHIPQSATKTARLIIGSEAVHLFSEPRKGPRADRYVFLTRSNRGFETQIRTAAVTPVKADMIVTGSLPKPAPVQMASLAAASITLPKAAGANQTSNDPVGTDQSATFGKLPIMPVALRTSASLFLSSLNRTPTYFPEFAEQKDLQDDSAQIRSTKISRGLKFKGESEKEYQVRQRRCLATAIYFEARGESTRGQLAVAQVIMNRVRSTLYPDTICGVVFQGQWRRTGCQFSFACDGRTDIARDKGQWRKANELAKRVTDGESWLGDIGYATHYHANYVKPRWRREMNKVKQVGRHIFYRVRAEQIQDALPSEGSPVRGLALSGSG